jgi:hypothetical protein
MTGGNQRRQCSFQLLRYVPDAVRNEYVHIGVILRGEDGELRVRFTRDWRRVRCLDPEVDTALLEGMESELGRLLSGETGQVVARKLDESLSLNVQITEPKAYLAESLPAGLEELMRMYVEMPARRRATEAVGRTAIQNRMRREFERVGVWDLLRKRIAAAEYTRPGDPLRIDAGYRPNGVIRMFHAVSLEPGVEMAKVLAFSSAGLHAGVERMEKAQLELTAIVEPLKEIRDGEDQDRIEMYRFGVETMEEHRIRVLTTLDMGRVAETARLELQV